MPSGRYSRPGQENPLLFSASLSHNNLSSVTMKMPELILICVSARDSNAFDAVLPVVFRLRDLGGNSLGDLSAGLFVGATNLHTV